jgi:predicted Zn finger-like uncharacterized protein
MGALATRCPECGTSFRVQRVQLTASDGLVRCGRCDAVFDARATLVDLDTGEPAAWEESPSPAPTAPAASPAPAAVGPSPAEGTQPGPAMAPPHGVPEADESTFPSTLAASDERWGSDERTDPAWDDTVLGVPPGTAGTAGPTEPALDPEALNERLRTLLGGGESASAAPSTAFSQTFSTLAPPSPKQRRPGRTAALALAAALLALAVPAQWAWIERTALRARWPALDAWLTQACPSCEARPWAHLDGWSVGASSLQPTPQGGALQLRLTVHNRSPWRLAVPWVDLRLLDNQGRVMLRKALSPAELGAAADRLGSGEQLTLQTTFRLKDGPGPQGALAPSGYEIGLFHP